MPAITCPTCKKSFQVDPAQSGLKLACPHCTQRIKVPDLPRPVPKPINKTVLASMDPSPAAPPPPPQVMPPAANTTTFWTKGVIIGLSVSVGSVLLLTLVLLIALNAGQTEYEASDVLTRFEKDAAAAETHFRGRPITIKGTFLGILRPYQIALEDRGSTGTDVVIVARFTADVDLRHLRRGHRVTFTAEYDTRTHDAIIFKNCVMR